MDYHRIYDELIEKRKHDTPKGYVERHHILPKCLGGGDEPENLIELTPEEHYLAHQLLVKIHPDNDSLVYAAQMMIPNRPSNKLYGWLKRRYSNVCKKRIGNANGSYGTRWICNIELQENKKISKDTVIPNGWIAGRNKWKTPAKKTYVCEKCGITFTAYRKRTKCSKKCHSKPTFTDDIRMAMRERIIKHNKSLIGTSGQGGRKSGSGEIG